MTKQIKADISLLAITAIWGSSFVLMKNVLDHIPSFAYLSLRFIIAGVILTVIFFNKLKNISLKTVMYGSVIGLMLFGGMALQVSGLYFTTASNSAFITGFNVVLVPVISVIFLKRKPDMFSVVGVTLAFAGLFFLTGGFDFRFNKGDFLTLLCAGCFALQIIFIDKFTRDQDPSLIAVIQIIFAALLYSCVWLITGFQKVSFDTTVVVTLLVTGVLGTAFAFTVQTIAQKHTSPTHTALILTAEPVFGALFAMVIPDSAGMLEKLQLHTAAGCVLILLGMVICEIKPFMTKKAHREDR